MKTVADILTEVSERVDDESNRRFPLTTLRRWIWEGEREVARRSECLRTMTEVAAISGEQNPELPTDIIRIHHVEYLPDGESQIYPLEYVDRRGMDPMWGTYQAIDSSNAPGFYTSWDAPPNMYLMVYPTPSSAGTYRVWYYRLPAPIASNGTDDSDQIDLPNGWEDLVTTYAEARCYRKDGRLEDYQANMGEFNNQIIAITQAAQRFSDQPGSIQYSPQWAGGGYGDVYPW